MKRNSLWTGSLFGERVEKSRGSQAKKEKEARESAFDNKKKKVGLKFNPRLVLTP